MKSKHKAKEIFTKVYECPALKGDITFIQAQIISLMMIEEIQEHDITCRFIRSFTEIAGYNPDTFTPEYWEEIKQHIMEL